MSNMQEILNEIHDFTLKHPSRFLIFGPSESGKSSFIEKLLKYSKQLFGFVFDRIIYISDQYFPANDQINGVSIEKYDEISSNLIENLNPSEKTIIIIDDLMNQAVKNKHVSDLYTQRSHHSNATVILVLHNLYPKADHIKTIFMNTTYFVLMANPLGDNQIRRLSYLIEGPKNTDIVDLFTRVTANKPYSYLFCDFDQKRSRQLRYRTQIFPDDNINIVFLKLK